MHQANPDLIVVGAGIFGLSVAWAARSRGMSVRVFEADRAGAGASGGIVGALTPHAPSRWRPMMSFQFEALLSLSDHLSRLEEESGLPVGYARTGRLTPLVTEKARASAERDAEAAATTWGSRGTFEVLENVPDFCARWVSPDAAPFGVARDTVSARVDPRAYVQALANVLQADVSEGSRIEQIDADACTVTVGGQVHSGGSIVLAAGWQVWDLLGRVAPTLQGTPVKGQAALLNASAEGLPVIYQDGLYLIPHAGGRVAVGSTSEKKFDDSFSTDEKLDALVERVRVICPALKLANVVERWAGLRPKPPGREPLVGPLPGYPRLWLAAGGFKISFGIAHAVADRVVSGLLDDVVSDPLPGSFDPAHRIDLLQAEQQT